MSVKPPNKANVARRAEVARLIALHRRPTDIVRDIGAQFGVVERTVHNDIRVHWEEVAAENAEHAGRRKSQMNGTLVRIMETALARGDLERAIKCADRIARLYGLYAPEVIEVTGNVAPLTVAMTSQRQRGRIVELLQRARERSGKVALELTGNGQIIDVNEREPGEDAAEVDDDDDADQD